MCGEITIRHIINLTIHVKEYYPQTVDYTVCEAFV